MTVADREVDLTTLERRLLAALMEADGRTLTRDQLLDNVTIYWFTGTGASSARLYWESAGPAPPLDPPATRPGCVGFRTVP